MPASELMKWILFLSQEYLKSTAPEVEMAAQLVLQKSFVWVPDVLWKIAEKCK